MSKFTYENLLASVAGNGVGIRARTQLEPLGGPGDKIFPPTYGVDARAETKYAMDTRRVNGEDVPSVLLDSVSSQANRFELALLEAIRSGELQLPLISVDFRSAPGVEDLDLLSALEVPHRVYDAVLRDSLLGGSMFRLSDVGYSITEATAKNAAALFHYSPTTLLFGGWDSTGPKGGRGSKFERAITSEIVAIGVRPGVKTSSRLDPLAIETAAAVIFESVDGTWTIDEADAKKDAKGNPIVKTGGGEGAAGRPSHINHGNVTPSIDDEAGGVTADEILAVTVLSFVALRRLRFPLDHAGAPVAQAKRRESEAAAHAALAAIGLAAAVLSFEDGFDLRSRCVLAPAGPLEFELLSRGGGEPERFHLDRAAALALVKTAAEAAAAAGLPWMAEELLLEPAGRLVDLVVRSRALSDSTSGDEETD
jgi:CRISPR-associated protein Csb1